MGRKCFVPFCTSGYDSNSERVSLFSVPKHMLIKWQKAIPRYDRKLSFKDFICEKHFRNEEIIREVKTAVYSYNLEKPKLSEEAIPSIFPKKPPPKEKIPATNNKTIKINMEDAFRNKLKEDRLSVNSNSVCFSKTKYDETIVKVIQAKMKTKNKTPCDYNILKKYDVIEVDGIKKLIVPLKQLATEIMYYVHDDELFKILLETHYSLRHGGRDRMMKTLKNTYKNITYKDIMIFLSLCRHCVEKQKKQKEVKVPATPGKRGESPLVIYEELNSSCWLDLIDYQSYPDDDYKFMMVYQENSTKFCILKPLKSKESDEIIDNLIDIFTLLGPPTLICLNVKTEFITEILPQIKTIWPQYPIPELYSEEDTSYSEEIDNIVKLWMETNKTTQWSKGLRFVQLMKNQNIHPEIERSPYEALFGWPLNAQYNLYNNTEENALLTETDVKTEPMDEDGDYNMEETFQCKSEVAVKEENIDIFNYFCANCGRDNGSEQLCKLCNGDQICKMDESSTSDNEFAFTSAEVSEDDKCTILNSLPEKSKIQYEHVYNNFNEWRKKQETDEVSESFLLTYFIEKSKKVKCSTLWNTYSLLKLTLHVKENIDISKYTKLLQFLKKKSVGYRAKKSKIFTREQINTFLTEANDDTYLLMKVILIMGISGGCRLHELVQMTVDDIKDFGSLLVVQVPDTKNGGNHRTFTISNLDVIEIYRKYAALRPSHTFNRRFFLKYQNGKCTIQVVGKNKIGEIPGLIAKYLKLPNAEAYTGHCFKKTSATPFANGGAEIICKSIIGKHVENSIQKEIPLCGPSNM